MSLNYPNGAGQALGDYLVTTFPLISSATIFYVNAATGNNTYDGLNEARPFATLVAAYAAASAGDMIVLMDGHAETINQQAFSKAYVAILGAGNSGGFPTVKLAFTGGASPGMTISGVGQQIRNVWFQSYTVAGGASASPRVSYTGTNGKMVGCYFECGVRDTGAGLRVASDVFEITSTTFISTAASSTTQPFAGMTLAAGTGEAGAHTLLRMDGVVFDGASHGFSNPYAYDDLNVVVTRLEVEALTLARGADASFNGSGNTSGFVNPSVVSGGSIVRF